MNPWLFIILWGLMGDSSDGRSPLERFIWRGIVITVFSCAAFGAWQLGSVVFHYLAAHLHWS